MPSAIGSNRLARKSFSTAQLALAHPADGPTSYSMSTMKPNSAKIIHHSEGLGAPDPDIVRKRAHEIATINGHSHFTDEDWREAKRELHGGHESNDTNGELDISAMASGHDMISGSLGHHVENMGMEDQDNTVEELIAEGMDEAVHEQMLAARREGDRENAEEEEDEA